MPAESFAAAIEQSRAIISQAYWKNASGQIYSARDSGFITEPNATYDAFVSSGGTVFPWPVDASGDQTDAALDAILTAYGLPTIEGPSTASLLAYANSKVATLLTTPRTYNVTDGITIFNDINPATTGVFLNSVMASLSTVTWPLDWSDDNYAVWSLSEANFETFAAAAFAYANSVWAFMNGTVIPGINSGTIKTTVAIDALSWPT